MTLQTLLHDKMDKSANKLDDPIRHCCSLLQREYILEHIKELIIEGPLSDESGTLRSGFCVCCCLQLDFVKLHYVFLV